MQPARILYCHCAYANIIPTETKTAVLDQLLNAGIEFDAVPDLCEMSARRDPRLATLVANTPLKIAACYPRAVQWLLASAGAKLDGQDVDVINMRTDSAEDVMQRLLCPKDDGGAA